MALFYSYQIQKELDDAAPFLVLLVSACLVDEFVSELNCGSLATFADDVLESIFE
jgi:hypothetical protein